MGVIGYAALILALLFSVISAAAYFLGGRNGSPGLLGGARGGLVISGGMVTVAVIVLLAAIFSHSFQFQYVYAHSTRDTSFLYLFSALWSGEEGSLLFWAWLIGIFSVVVAFQKREKNAEFVPYAAAVILLVQAFLILLLVTEANPFTTLGFTPANGTGLNPLLENPGNIIHPPALIAGYAGLTVPFAFALAALLKRRLNNDWLGAVRRWTLLAWVFLGAGNIIGAWWAYVELGWGGYWAWDPVENAGLMPWLLATAFLHSMIVQRHRNMFKSWTILLAVLAFNMVIFGTFINRTGVISSVHSFVVEGLGPMGPYFLVFLGISLITSFWLLFSRQRDLKGEDDINELVSRESSFLFNNILLVGLTLVVLVGTVFPSISQAIRGTRIEVGEDFFNRVGGPVFLAIIALAGLCTVLGWRSARPKDLARRLLWPAGVSLVVVILLLVFGIRQWAALVGTFICAAVFLAILYQWFREADGAGFAGFFRSLGRRFWRNRTRYGAYIVHISLVIMAIGIIGSSLFDIEREVSIPQGGSATIKDYTLVNERLNISETADRQYYSATINVYKGSRLVDTMEPELFFTQFSEQPFAESAIRTTLREDLFIVLASLDFSSGTAILSVLVNPLVVWIWIGGVIFIIGGLVAFWPARPQSPLIIRDTSAAPPETSAQVEDEIERRVRQLRERRAAYCAQCGAPVGPGERFCSQCGARLPGGESK